jgi:type III pantothenate kinase
MLLTIDIGNTNITLGLYDGETLGPRWRLATAHEHMPDEYGLQFAGLLGHVGFGPAALHGICLASVVPPLTGKIVEACRSYLQQEPLVVDAGVKTGVRVRYEDPKAVGADRIVDAAAVQRLYGGPACVVDFGTATTFDGISAEGVTWAGPSPGIGIAAEALFLRTAKLPPSICSARLRPSGATRFMRCSPAAVRLRGVGGGWWGAFARSWGRR